jgi:hypothetical protein
MDRDSSYAATVRTAAAIVGDDARLCELLDVPTEEISKWLTGESLPSLEGYVRALNIVLRRAAEGA